MWCCAVALVLAGCATSQVQWDAVQLRQQVMDFYNDEIMENLIREEQGLPYVQVDMSLLTAVVSSKLTGSVGGGETRTNASTDSAVGVLSGIAHTVMRPFSLSASPERGQSLTITTTPVLGNKKIYEPYRTFFTKGGKLEVRQESQKPQLTEYVPGALKKWGHQYYFVPSNQKKNYRDLCLKVFQIDRVLRPSLPASLIEQFRGQQLLD
jgi:hypothetical protein